MVALLSVLLVAVFSAMALTPDNMQNPEEKRAGWILLFDGATLNKGCNSRIFVRTLPLEPRPDKDVGFNGIKIAIDDTTTAGHHDTTELNKARKSREYHR
ncbi:MAG: hypothetical protein ACP5XB_05550 [Isosphaeraceae bacterium]